MGTHVENQPIRGSDLLLTPRLLGLSERLLYSAPDQLGALSRPEIVKGECRLSMTAAAPTQQTLDLAGTRIEMVKGGSGKPLLVLHDEMGHPGWMRFHEALSQKRTLYIPSHPGFGQSERLDWVRSVRDMASWYLHALDDLALGPVDVLGISLGGWLAAEIASLCPHQLKNMVLVAPPGIRPPSGEIFDMFVCVAKSYLEEGFYDSASVPEFTAVLPEEPDEEQREAWEVAREQACRLTWKPYMNDPTLPFRLRRLKGLQTLIIWGRQDAVVPLSAGEVYRDSIAGSRLAVLERCGHRAEIEKSDDLSKLVLDFLD